MGGWTDVSLKSEKSQEESKDEMKNLKTSCKMQKKTKKKPLLPFPSSGLEKMKFKVETEKSIQSFRKGEDHRGQQCRFMIEI